MRINCQWQYTHGRRFSYTIIVGKGDFWYTMGVCSLSLPMKALIYTTHYCPYCTRAKNKLEELGIDYTEIDVTHDEEKRDEMIAITGRSTVPQIFLHLGGCDDLLDAADRGKLTLLLS